MTYIVFWDVKPYSINHQSLSCDLVLGSGQLQMADDISCDVKEMSRSGCQLTFISEVLMSELIH